MTTKQLKEQRVYPINREQVRTLHAINKIRQAFRLKSVKRFVVTTDPLNSLIPLDVCINNKNISVSAYEGNITKEKINKLSNKLRVTYKYNKNTNEYLLKLPKSIVNFLNKLDNDKYSNFREVPEFIDKVYKYNK